MIKAIALDDEPLPLRLLKNFSAQTDFVHLLAGFTSPIEASAFINENEIGLIFLDIQMPGISGIEFLKTLPPGIMVIFTTAFSEYAVEGFNLNAIDYLLKPFELDRYLQAVTKAREHMSFRDSRPADKDSALVVKVDHEMVKIPLEDILYVEGINNYIRIFIKDKRPVLVRMTVKDMADKIVANGFMRVHRSYIIPLSKVVSVKRKVISLGYADIPVGINYISDVQQLVRENK